MSYEDREKLIQERIKKKDIRQNKTELSIGFRWAVNCAIAFLPEKLKGTDEGFKQVKKWQEEFTNIDREFMIDNLPQDVIEVTDTPLPSSAKGITTNWDEKKQELYNEASKQDEHRVEYEQTK